MRSAAKGFFMVNGVRKLFCYGAVCACMLSALLLLPDVCPLPLLFLRSRLLHEGFDAGFWMQYFPVWGAELAVLIVSLLLKKLCFPEAGALGAFVRDRKRVLFALMLAIFFCASNARVLLRGGFQGYYNGWDYGDLLKHLNSYGNRSNLYDSNYPPFATLIYKLFYCFVPLASKDAASALGYVLFLFFLGTLLPLFVLIRAFLGGSEHMRLLGTASFFISGPVLYVYQRANVAFFALVLLLFFLLYFRSEYRFLRELALLALALSANIKYYPAIFGMLLLKEHRWKDAARCAVYGVVVFALPAILSPFLVSVAAAGEGAVSPVQVGFIQDSVRGMNAFTRGGNLGFLTGTASSSLSLKAHLYNAVLVHLDLPEPVAGGILWGALAIFFAFTLWLVAIAKKRYQELFLLGTLCIFVPTLSFWYSTLFLIPALLYFLEEKQDSAFCTCAGLLLFIAIFCYAVALSYGLTPDRVWHIVLLYALLCAEVLSARRRGKSLHA
jgi:hypothetical protein